MRTSLRLLGLLSAVSLGVLAAGGGSPATASGSHALIQGSGSSWASNAVNQWIADVQTNGLQVVFTASGSAQGRKDFANKVNDFAVSDIGYQGSDPLTGDQDTPCSNPADPSTCRPFAYLPIVAGGTSFPYQVRVGGQMVRNLRLSGETLAKIFTNKITNWNDPAITADNNGRRLPSLPIIPVVHSEGSGSTAQFTRYLNRQYPAIWQSFNGGRSGMTEYFPRSGGQIAQNGSDGVMNFIASGAANGAIGYDEYSYALAKNFPVAKLENAAGVFTAPTQYNVAVALTKALINQDKSSKDYLLQNLDQVYVNADERTYPMSSYSYMLIPTAANDPRMTTAKRQTLADYLYYSVCQGQAEMGPIGYSPLPINLVQASFEQTAKLKQADPGVDLTQRDVTTCHNPTFIAGQPDRNYLAEIAPAPPSCDHAGAGPCDAVAGLANGNPVDGKPTGSAAPAAGAAGSTLASGTAGHAGAGASGPQADTANAALLASPDGAAVDPATGEPLVAGAPGAGVSGLVGSPVDLAATRVGGMTGLFAGLTVAELLIVFAAPPLLGRWLSSRRRSAP